MWWCLVVALVISGCAEEAAPVEPSSRADCEELIEQLAALEIASQSAHATAADDAVNAQHRAQLAAVFKADERELAMCQERHTSADVACAIAAKTTAAARTCLAD